MKKNFKTMAAAIAVTGTMAMTMGMSMSAFAADTKNGNSNFTISNETPTDTPSINLIKDYDAENLTKKDEKAPLSESPKETFTYTIKPYAVWNAGNTFVTSGTAPTTTDTPTKISTNNMPMFAGFETTTAGERVLTLTQEVGVGAAIYGEDNDRNVTPDTNKLVLNLPKYESVGDYWYEVEELKPEKETTGVLYGTNSLNDSGNSTTDTKLENGGHNRIYYIHVQVTETNETAGKPSLIRTVTMHQSAPDPNNAKFNNDANYNDNISAYYQASNKVNAIENRYYAGDLVIKKEVTGNAGDKSEYFKVTVVFTKPAGTIVNSDITYTAALLNDGAYTSTPCTIKGQGYEGASNSSTIKWSTSNVDSATATCVFYVKDNSTVTFSNIPYGINYTIQESEPENDTYQNVIKFTSDSADGTTPKFDGKALTEDTDSAEKVGDNFEKFAEGSISDARDEVTITNKKENTIDVGVLLSNAPYAAMLALAGTAGVVFVKRRKKDIED